MKTIRKNATKKIRALLEGCAIITEYRYDDMSSSTNRRVTVDEVMDADARCGFSSVYDSGVSISLSMHGNWFFTAYKTEEAARALMTPKAFARYFPAEKVAA